MPRPFVAGAVIYAKDIRLISRFYSEVAGLEVARDERDFVVLESQAFQLVVVAMAKQIADRVAITSPAQRREDTAVKICFAVDSVASARDTAAQLGGAIDAPEQEWRFQGARVCDGQDPEGNVIQVRAEDVEAGPSRPGVRPPKRG